MLKTVLSVFPHEITSLFILGHKAWNATLHIEFKTYIEMKMERI